MGYFNTTYYNSLMHADVKRDLNGTSISKEKGTDNKANNTSAYNHDYYIRHKEKWQDNKDSKASDNAGDDKSGLKEGDFDIDAAALDVIRGKYGNGQARKDALGDDYEMIQKRVNEMYKSGKFGGGTNTDSNSNSSSNNVTESSGASSNGKWYTKYNDRIKDAKAAKTQKEAQEAEAKRQQEESAKEAKSKNKNRRRNNME